MVKLFSALIFIGLMVSCGKEEKETIRYVNVPQPQPPPVITPPGGGDQLVTWATVRPIIDDHCALSGCHSGTQYLKDEDLFIDSFSKERIANDSMPPPYGSKIGQWNDQLKSTMLKYFESKGR